MVDGYGGVVVGGYGCVVVGVKCELTSHEILNRTTEDRLKYLTSGQYFTLITTC